MRHCVYFTLVMLITRLIYSFSLKAFSLIIIRNDICKSENKSQLKEPVILDKIWQATIAMVRVTKLIQNSGLTLDGKCNITGNGLSSIWVIFRMYSNSRVNIERNFCWKYYLQRPKAVHDVNIRTMGNSKERKFYGFGGLVIELMTRRGSEIRQFYCKSSINLLKEGVVKKSKIDIKYDRITKVIHDIADLKNLILAYESIKSNAELITFKFDDFILSDININWLSQLSLNLLAGKFQFAVTRKVDICTLGQNEIKLVKLASFQDKIVQVAILQVLEPIYENIFLDCSHGFRPNRSCHTALQSLKYKLSNSVWVIKGNISECDGFIDHNILLATLRQNINCDKTLSLIKKFLKSTFYKKEQLPTLKKKIFQDNFLSSLLYNIYLHKMDLYVKEMQKSFDKNLKKKFLNAKFHKLNSKDSFDLNSRKLTYIRYADNFVIGIIGSKNDGICIRNDLNNFLSKKLFFDFNLTKIKIAHFNKNGIFFLDTFIKGNCKRKKIVKIAKKDDLKFQTRVISTPRLLAPIERILLKGVENNVFKRIKSGKIVPTAVRKLINWDHASILRFFNSKICKIFNYYFFVDNVKSLKIVVYNLKHSCALTLALKYKLRYRSKVFKKFGKYLKCKDSELKILTQKTFSRT